jgi:hypothetical protein
MIRTASELVFLVGSIRTAVNQPTIAGGIATCRFSSAMGSPCYVMTWMQGIELS